MSFEIDVTANEICKRAGSEVSFKKIDYSQQSSKEGREPSKSVWRPIPNSREWLSLRTEFRGNEVAVRSKTFPAKDPEIETSGAGASDE